MRLLIFIIGWNTFVCFIPYCLYRYDKYLTKKHNRRMDLERMTKMLES